MTRSLLALTTVLVAASAAPAWSQPVFSKSGSATFSTLTAQSIGAGAMVNGTPLSTVVSQAASAAPQTALTSEVQRATGSETQIAAVAAAALPVASLPSTTIRANFDDISRTLADRLSDRLNVKAFGAKGDGVTDDTVAFQNAAAVATGHIPSGIGASLSGYLNGLGNFLGIGVKINGAVEIDVPAGHYVLSAPITVNYQTNSAVHWKGDGSAMTELEFKGGVDGLVTNFAANTRGNEASRGGSWLGQGISVEGIHFIANTGIVKLNPGSTNAGAGQGESGTAIKTIAIPVLNSTMPPFQIYRDLLFSNSGGWSDGANNWKTAIYLQDPDNVFVEKAVFEDHSLDNNRTSIPFWVHSTATATGPGHGNINFDYPLIMGGVTGIQIDGNAIQGVNITHGSSVGVQDAISWLVGANTLSGSLTIADGSFGAARHMVNLLNVSTVYSHDNFFYNVAPPKYTDPVFFSAGGGDTLVSHNDQFYGPAAGWEGTDTAGTTHTATAMFVTGVAATDTASSHVSDDTISHFDTGILFGGGTLIAFTNDVVSSDTTSCYRDTSTSTDTTHRAVFDGIYCGNVVNQHDGVGLTSDIDWTVQRYMNAGLELGLPGVVSPSGVTGYAGTLDFHSTTSSNGGISGLSDYDVRLTTHGGTAGKVGLGTFDVYGTGGLNVVNGPVTAPSLKLTGAASIASGTVTGTLSVGQYLILGTMTMANLPSGCGAGGLIYVSDGRKTGEAAGAGSGVPAVCLPASKGGATSWFAIQASTLSN